MIVVGYSGQHESGSGYQKYSTPPQPVIRGDYILLEPLSSETQRTGPGILYIYRERERDAILKNILKHY
jgi:hypothetical protein